VVVGPVLVTVFAILFDVGFFFNIGYGFFSLFSLSEHLIFAMRAIPVSIFTLGSFYILLIVNVRLTIAFDQTIRLLRSTGWRSNLKIAAAACFSAIFLCFIIFWEAYNGHRIDAGVTVGALICGVIFFLFRHNENVVSLLSLALSLSIAFGLGLLNWYYFQTTDSPLNYTLISKGRTFDGSIIIGGERGILFFDKRASKIYFLKLESVEMIER
jgi:hypothetical protein